MKEYKVYIKELNSFEDIIKKIDSFGVGFIAVVNDSEHLFGIVTDGDVRKALLNQKKEVLDIINATPLTLLDTTPKEEIITYLKKNRRLHLPLVDDKGFLKKVFLLNDFDVEYKENYIIIMAGGLGSRLGDLTKDFPKPMLQIKGKPILEYIVDSFKNQGFYKFIFCLNHKKEVIQEYFKDGKDLGVEIEYLIENKKLGTAGPLSLLKKDKFKEPFFVINGDVITCVDYQSMLNNYILNKADALMCTKEESYTNPFAEVTFDEHQNLIDLKEKPTTTFNINLGVYLLNSSVLPLLPINEYYDMPNLFIKAKEESLKVKVFSVNDDWIDIGKPLDYLKIKND
jgi:dTDP-glucose pyrophosphorylase